MRYGSQYDVGEWFEYRPWVYNRYTGHESGGRWSKAHLVDAVDDDAAHTRCGKKVLWCDMASDSSMSDPTTVMDHRLKAYCKRCLNAVGIERPKNNQRDHQRQKVYNAEAGFYGSGFVARDVDEASDYTNMVLMDAHNEALFPGAGCNHLTGRPRPVKVRQRNGNAWRAHADAREIALGGRSMDEYTILHELAHTIHRRMKARYQSWKRDTRYDQSGHGSVYCGILLELVALCMGPKDCWKLRCAFIEGGVKVDDWSDVRPDIAH